MFCVSFLKLTIVLKIGERKLLVESIGCRYSSGKHILLHVISSQSLIIQSLIIQSLRLMFIISRHVKPIFISVPHHNVFYGFQSIAS